MASLSPVLSTRVRPLPRGWLSLVLDHEDLARQFHGSFLRRGTTNRDRLSHLERRLMNLSDSPRQAAPDHLVVVDVDRNVTAILGGAQHEDFAYRRAAGRAARPATQGVGVFAALLQ